MTDTTEVQETNEVEYDSINPARYVGYDASAFMREAISGYLEAMTGFVHNDIDKLRKGAAILFGLSLLGIQKHSYHDIPYKVCLTMLPDEDSAVFDDPAKVKEYEDTLIREINRTKAISLSIWDEDKFGGNIKWPVECEPIQK